jgi:hypothetical protein
MRGHQCPRLFFLESTNFLVDDPIDDVADEVAIAVALEEEPPIAPVVSLYALTGIRTKEAMHLHVYIHGHKLLALLDSSSTHNFINVGVMRRIGLDTGDSNM